MSVSKHATCGSCGYLAATASIPSMPPGMCSGANGIRFFKSARSAGVTSSGATCLAPPWTIRWPTASRRGSFRRSNSSNNASTASCGRASSRSDSAIERPLASRTLTLPPLEPTRSAAPSATTDSAPPATAYNANLHDDEPTLMQSMWRAGKPDSSVARFRRALLEDSRDQFLRLGLNAMQVIGAAKALRINLVNLFGARRTRREPSALRDDLDAADRRVVSGRNRQRLDDFLARELAIGQLIRRQLLQNFLLREGCGCVDSFVHRRTELLREVVVNLSGIAAHARGHLGRQQPKDEAVLVRRPHGAVGAQKRTAGTFLTAKSDRTIDQPVHEPLEADRRLDELAFKAGRNAIDHAAAHHGLADGGVFAPSRAIGKQVRDRDREIVIRIHQPARARDDSMPVRIGVVGKGDVETIALREQADHRVRRRAIHPDLPVPVGGHEAKRRIDDVADDGRLDAVLLDHGGPVMHSCAAERIDSNLNARAPNLLHVDDVAEVADVGADVVVLVQGRGRERALVWNALHSGELVFEEFVSRILNPICDPRVGRAAVGRIVLEATVSGRIVRWRDHDPIRQPILAPAIVSEDRVRDRRRRRVAVRA